MEAFNTGGYCAGNKPNPTTGAQTPSGCPKCGKLKKEGKLSCCARGGAWFKQCGKPGDSKYDHTWSDGIQACQNRTLDVCTLILKQKSCALI